MGLAVGPFTRAPVELSHTLAPQALWAVITEPSGENTKEYVSFPLLRDFERRTLSTKSALQSCSSPCWEAVTTCFPHGDTAIDLTMSERILNVVSCSWVSRLQTHIVE